jgi:hypothetical protein
MITITKTITQPEEVITQFADDLGYQTVVTVPEEELPAQVEVQQENHITKEMETVLTYPEGTEFTKPNPQTRLEFVSEKFDDFVSDKFFGQFARRDAERAARQMVEDTVIQTKEAIKETIVTL